MRSSALGISLTRPWCRRASSAAEMWPVASSLTADFRTGDFLANHLIELIARHETNRPGIFQFPIFQFLIFQFPIFRIQENSDQRLKLQRLP